MDGQTESYVYIKFTEPGSVIFMEPPQMVGVHPFQLLAMAEYLRVTANAAILEMREASKVAIPRADAVGQILKPND